MGLVGRLSMLMGAHSCVCVCVCVQETTSDTGMMARRLGTGQTTRSMSSSLSEEPPVMVIDCSLPVPLSFEET